MNSMFSSILNEGPDAGTFLICTGVSIVLGILIALVSSVKNRQSQTMLITLILLPAIVQTVIMMVNGNIGTGIAVAGAFSLVRFRSAQGNARDISLIFLAMAVGIATGTGFVLLAGCFTLIICATYALVLISGIGSNNSSEKELKITIPENLDYTDVFDDILNEYTSKWQLSEVKTINMGSMYKIGYLITMKKGISEKDFIDNLRCRNGNLEICLSRCCDTEHL